MEFLVLLALHKRFRAGARRNLHERESAQPRHVQPATRQRFDHGGVIGDRNELDLHPGLLLEVFAQRREFALELSRRLVGNRGDLQNGLLPLRHAGDCSQDSDKRTFANQSSDSGHGSNSSCCRD